MAVIWDLKNESGAPAQVQLQEVDAREWLERDPERYSRELPAGTAAGPLTGPRRIVIG